MYRTRFVRCVRVTWRTISGSLVLGVWRYGSCNIGLSGMKDLDMMNWLDKTDSSSMRPCSLLGLWFSKRHRSDFISEKEGGNLRGTVLEV